MVGFSSVIIGKPEDTGKKIDCVSSIFGWSMLSSLVA
jgi:hypothetical protein